LFAVGSNETGAIGDGKIDICSKIKQIDYFKNIFIKDVTCGRDHCLSISNKGEIFGWGGNEFCQIGNANLSKIVKVPIKIYQI
jgi:alpha-tubulin suppressor-like RCC1 family protein